MADRSTPGSLGAGAGSGAGAGAGAGAGSAFLAGAALGSFLGAISNSTTTLALERRQFPDRVTHKECSTNCSGLGARNHCWGVYICDFFPLDPPVGALPV